MAGKTKTADAKEPRCPITRAHFHENAAAAVTVHLDGIPVIAKKHEFKPNGGSKNGSLGWFSNGKMTMMVGGIPVDVQCNIMLTIVGSKERDS